MAPSTDPGDQIVHEPRALFLGLFGWCGVMERSYDLSKRAASWQASITEDILADELADVVRAAGGVLLTDPLVQEME
jgi:hypothetical protein